MIKASIKTAESCKERIENIQSNIDSAINELEFMDEIGHPAAAVYRAASEANIDLMRRLKAIEEDKLKSIQN